MVLGYFPVIAPPSIASCYFQYISLGFFILTGAVNLVWERGILD